MPGEELQKDAITHEESSTSEKENTVLGELESLDIEEDLAQENEKQELEQITAALNNEVEKALQQWENRNDLKLKFDKLLTGKTLSHAMDCIKDLESSKNIVINKLDLWGSLMNEEMTKSLLSLNNIWKRVISYWGINFMTDDQGKKQLEVDDVGNITEKDSKLKQSIKTAIQSEAKGDIIVKTKDGEVNAIVKSTENGVILQIKKGISDELVNNVMSEIQGTNMDKSIAVVREFSPSTPVMPSVSFWPSKSDYPEDWSMESGTTPGESQNADTSVDTWYDEWM